MSINKKLNLELDDVVYDYKLFDTLKAIKSNKSQRKAAKELGISHTVLNRRIIKAEELLSEPLVLVSNKGSTLTNFALNLLEKYELYEQRLNDDDFLVMAGGFISCEFIRELSIAYQLDNIKILQTDMETAFDLANRGFVDILGFDDPVQAYIYDLEPVPLGRDKLMLLTHGNERFNNINDLNGLNFVEVEDSAQRLAWTTLANNDLDFNIVKTVKSFHEAIRTVEQDENVYTFINNSISYTSLNTSDVLSEYTQHIISALNVKNSVDVESFLNFASHSAQKLTVKFGFEPL
jgi:molybdate transport repressor ModE-like protein